MIVVSVLVVLVPLEVHVPAYGEGGGGIAELGINGSVGENVCCRQHKRELGGGEVAAPDVVCFCFFLWLTSSAIPSSTTASSSPLGPEH